MSSTDPMEIRLEYVSCANFAMQQNDVPLIRALALHNGTTTPLSGVTVRIQATPAVIEPITVRLGALAAGTVTTIPPEQLRTLLLRDSLVNQEEREKGEIWVEALAADGTSMVRRPFPFDVLAYNEWYGVSSLPEILAAFVMPNHPAVEPVIARATALLRERTGNGKIAAYQNDERARMLEEVTALYDALAEKAIAYVNPPPSFEQTGQKIRTPDQVLSARLGTCLDLATLLAAVLESGGYAPLLFLKKGHAYAGVWLKDTSFESAVVPAGLTVKKRIDLGEMLAIEATGLTATPPAGLKYACGAAGEHFAVLSEFRYAVDVRMARRMGIRPMAARMAPTHAKILEFPQPEPVPAPAEAAIPVLPPDDDGGTAAGKPMTRLDRWKRKLLDLSRRNPLLNFRETLRTVSLLCPDLGALEDALAGGRAFDILPVPKVMSEKDPRSADVHRERTGTDALTAFLASQLEDGRLHASLDQDNLARHLLEISRTERVNVEETGANTVFLALGFLRWYEDANSSVASLAPIILVPMQIERRSVREGFRISMLDEESRINVTLLEKLKADFGMEIPGLDPLPEDDSGLNVNAILHRIREAVKDTDRWEVLNDAAIAILTFNKFMMWLDLEYHVDILRESPVARHLLESPAEPFPGTGEVPPADELDRLVKPADVYCPLDADSSQLAAVLAAENRVSFVLQGPPGTGKSQTIANLIAHCMTKGRRVLFVSEKMAALEVVKKRLEDVGLGPFCLELHSKKANKHDFRRQMEEVLQLERCLEPAEWQRKADQLQQDRTELNAYVNALHAPRPFGQTAFWALSRMMDYREIADVDCDFGHMAAMTPEKADGAVSQGRKLQTAAETAAAGPTHALRELRVNSWNLGMEGRATALLDSLMAAATDLESAAGPALQPLRLGSGRWSRYVLDFARDLSGCLLECPPVPMSLARASDWSQTRTALEALVAVGRKRDELEGKLLQVYTPAMMNLPVEQMQQILVQSRQSAFPFGWWQALKIRGALSKTLRAKLRLTVPVMEQHLQSAVELLAQNRRLEAGPLSALFGAYWNNGRADWDLLARQIAWVTRFKETIARIETADPTEAMQVWDLWASLACEKRDMVTAAGPVGRAFVLFREKAENYERISKEVTALLQPGGDSESLATTTPDHLSTMRSAAERWKTGVPELRAWCAYQAARTGAIAAGLEPAVRLLEDGTVPAASFTPLCEKAFARWCLREILAEDAALARFFGAEHNRRITSFRELDSMVRDLTRLTVFAHLTMRLPRQGMETDRLKSSETGIIKRFVKGGRISIRQMFADCPEALSRLKPCVLMSPLSVAQYMGAHFPRFDMVVFDEASQMPPWEAIGAIGRANQVIVVGDSKQLPPTSFFEKVTDEEDDTQEEAQYRDLESILDECQVCHLPVHSLKWHYRSKHESLIAFSNGHYYCNELLTFPSAGNRIAGLGVVLRSVPNGFYDASKSRTNQGEAEALVAEIVTRLKDPAQQVSSIGVVTFSIAQQRLIEDLLEEARHKHPQIEPFFTSAVNEPVFVKNLETVQGDERDVILFSVCYAPNQDGKLRMNFGPLNNKGGERRLNVAITRARRQLVVFATLRADKIDLARTDAVGVRDLKAFLGFAASGGSVPRGETTSGGRGTESPFEEEVRDLLAARGWEIDTQVGCSGYRVDLAVKHPQHKGCYMLGIECDGASYHSARTARDRDRLRHAVLKSLGWQLTRVWSTDWWLNRDKEVDRLHRELQAAAEAFAFEKIAACAIGVNRLVKTNEQDTPDPAASAHAMPEVVHEVIVDANGDGRPDLPGQALYGRARPSSAGGRAEDFHESRSTRDITGMIAAVLAVEAPVSAELLAARVGEAWNLPRITGKVVERVARMAVTAGARMEDAGARRFLWRSDQDVHTYPGFRVPAPDDGFVREAEHIPPQEVANAVHELLKEHLSLSREDLVKAVATLFGFSRVGNRVRQAMEEGIDCYAARVREPDSTMG